MTYFFLLLLHVKSQAITGVPVLSEHDERTGAPVERGQTTATLPPLPSLVQLPQGVQVYPKADMCPGTEAPGPVDR